MIKKLPLQRKFRLYSTEGKNLGTFPKRELAEAHERQVNFFKHLAKKKK